MSMQAEQILEALSKKYEKRTIQEHRLLSGTIASYFPTLSTKKVRLLTFYLELRLPPTDIHPESMLDLMQITLLTLFFCSFLQHLIHNYLLLLCIGSIRM